VVAEINTRAVRTNLNGMHIKDVHHLWPFSSKTPEQGQEKAMQV
jgi:hypothetical protein